MFDDEKTFVVTALKSLFKLGVMFYLFFLLVSLNLHIFQNIFCTLRQMKKYPIKRREVKKQPKMIVMDKTKAGEEEGCGQSEVKLLFMATYCVEGYEDIVAMESNAKGKSHKMIEWSSSPHQCDLDKLYVQERL